MLQINSFSGPQMALLWGHARELRLPYLVAIPAGILLAYGEATVAWNRYVQFLVLVILLTIFTAKATETNDAPDINLRLPVSSSKLAGASIAAASIFANLFCVAYIATFGLFAASSKPLNLIYVFAVFIFALHGLCLKRIHGQSVPRVASTLLSVATVGLIGLLVVAIPWNWPPNGGTRLLGISILIAVAYAGYYPLLNWLFKIQRHGSQQNFGLDTRAAEYIHRLSVYQADDATTDSEIREKPLASRFNAEIWYTLHMLARSCTRNFSFWASVPGVFLYGALLLNSFPAHFPEHLYALSLALLGGRFGWWWYRAAPQRPLSEWTESRMISGVAGIAVLACVTILWPLHVLTSDSEATLSISKLFLALWVVWTGLAFSPCILLYIILGFIYHHTVAGHFPITSSDICALWLFALTLFQRWRSRPLQPRGGRWLLALIVLLLISSAALSQLEPGRYSIWIGREVLGVTLVLTLLLHHVFYHSSSKQDAYRCGVFLTGFALLSTAAVATMGLPDEPALGVTATFLTFGYAPSLFLPIVVLPHYLAWQKYSATAHRRSRKDAM